jgi:HEAT repeat protein
MKRNVIVLLVIVLSLGVVGLAAVGITAYIIGWPIAVGSPKEQPPATPLSFAELDDLLDKPDKAAESLTRIISCFWQDDEELRAQASEVLRNVGARAVEPLRAHLNSKTPAVRFWIVQTLGAIGPEAAASTDDLVARTQDDEADVRYKAVFALGRVGMKSDKAVGAVLKALEDKDGQVAQTALEVLEQMGAPPKEALPTLEKLAGKNSPEAARATAIKLLGKMGEPAVPAFKKLLRDTPPHEATDLAKAIADLGPHAKPLLPDLQTIMLTNVWFFAQNEMLLAFKKCGPEGAQGLSSVLKKVSAEKTPIYDPVRGAAILKTLGEMGADAKGAVPTLIPLLKDNAFRPHVLETLGDIGPAAKEAIPAVEALVNDSTPRSDPARVALRRMGKI